MNAFNIYISAADDNEIEIGEVIRKKPALIELLDSDDCVDMGSTKMTDLERKEKHQRITKRLHRNRKTPCKLIWCKSLRHVN